MITPKYPINAVGVTYIYRSRQYQYWVWEKGGQWWWARLSHSSHESTKELAGAAARRWIRDGQ